MARWILTAALCLAAAFPGEAAAQPSTGAAWARVDALPQGTRIVVTLTTGERRTRVFLRATTEDIIVARRGDSTGGEETLSKNSLTSVALRDPIVDGLGRGAVLGAAAFAAVAGAQIKSCNTGCDWGSTGAIAFAWAVLGAGAGSVVGLAADADSRAEMLYPPRVNPAAAARRAGGSFARRPAVRLGLAYTTTALRTSLLEGRAPAAGFAAAVQLSPRISVHAEYVALDARFVAAAGAIPDDVLRNVVQPFTRVAGRTHGIESRRVSYVFTELVGFHPAPRGRVRVEVLGGIGVQGEEERAYYDAHRQLADGRTETMPGKYYVLDFGSPEVGLVVGIDAEIAVAGGLRLVPTVRYHAMEPSSASLTYGIGAHWRF